MGKHENDNRLPTVWSFVTTINRWSVSGMNPHHTGHYMGKERHKIRNEQRVSYCSLLHYVLTPMDARAKNRIQIHHWEVQYVFHWDSPVIRKGAFYLDILCITIDRGVSIKAMYSSFWRFPSLTNGWWRALCGVCCNTSKPEVKQGYLKLDSVLFRVKSVNYENIYEWYF